MNKKGFTLIELLAVIVIIALIAVIAVPKVSNIIEEQKGKGYKLKVESTISILRENYIENPTEFLDYVSDGNNLLKHYGLSDKSFESVTFNFESEDDLTVKLVGYYSCSVNMLKPNYSISDINCD